MIERKSTFFLGIFIFLIPFLGLPSFWKTILITVCGFLVVALSIKIILPKKNTRAKSKREKVTPVFVENIPVYPKNDTMEAKQLKVKSEDREKN